MSLSKNKKDTKQEIDDKTLVDSCFLNNVIQTLESNGYLTKEAVVGNKRKEYIKEKDFLEYADKCKDQLFKLCSNIKNYCFNLTPESNESIGKQLINSFITQRLIVEVKVPVYDRKLKYPKKLKYITLNNSEGSDLEDGDLKTKDKRKFYVIINDRQSTSKTSYYLWILIFVVLAFCMFPLWPIEVKLGIWWVSYILLIVLLGFILLRLLFYVCFYIFGVEFWLFPNFDNDKLGFIESFKPLYSIEKRNETYITIVIRLAIALIISYISYSIYFNPKLIDDGLNHMHEIYYDILNYGNDKILNYHNSTSISIVDKSNTYMRDIDNELGLDI